MIDKLKKQLETREIGINAEGVVRHYSVLIPLVNKNDEWFVVFERRSQNVAQSNDICFPGGRVEKDESYPMAAVRETVEELLLEPEQVEILGPLDLYIAHDHLIVHPYIGVLHDYALTYSQDEVSEIHLVKLDELLNKEPEVYGGKLTLQLDENFPYSRIEGGKSYPWREASRKIVFYNFSDITIWGMTAQILRSALKLIKQI